jgi:UDP-N-acetylglucosamine 2-epimerase
MTMPEEVNRRVTDHVSSVLFAPTKTTVRNLYAEGISRDRVRLVGDTMVDALLAAFPGVSRLRGGVLSRLDASDGEYVLVTAHRPGNVDVPRRLGSIVRALLEVSKKIRIVFPAHPRTLKQLASSHLVNSLKRSRNVVLSRPVGYLELIALLESAAAVLTDSGGIQKEAFLLGVPCVTMRRATEWPETVRAGANVLVDADGKKILQAVLQATKKQRPRRRPILARNPFGDGKASNRIVNTILHAR